MASKQWHVLIDGEMLGPMSGKELAELASLGAVLADTPASTDRVNWTSAGTVPGLTFPTPPPSPPEVFPSSTVSTFTPGLNPVEAHDSHGVVRYGIPAAAILAVVLVAMVAWWMMLLSPDADRDGRGSVGESNSAKAKGHAAANEDEVRYPGDSPWRLDVEEATAADHSASPNPARLTVSCSDATNELIPIVQRMTAQEQAALGLAAFATGVDIYAARVTLRNDGNVPIRVYPGNIRIHFGSEFVGVYTIADPRFLRDTVVQPGRSTSGLVTYTARMDIGAAIRMGGGGLSYEDPTVLVTYR